jgi:hypothetical protein
MRDGGLSGLSQLNLHEVSIDEEGRVVVANPEMGRTLELWEAAAAKPARPRPVPNTNCAGCNTVAGCGPVNSVKNCGCGSLK